MLLYFQDILFLNPENFGKLRWDQILNTVISSVTNTNWQAYKIEAYLSYLTRILGIGVQNFLASAMCITIAIALINSFIRKNTTLLGNFWVYLTRTILYILLPLSIILAMFLITQGTPNNLQPYVHAQTLEGKEQIIAQGPVASQIAIKQLGTSGGGFFAVTSSHPYENPTPLTDLINILAFMLIAAAFPFTFGAMLKDRSQGWTIFTAMLILFCLGLGLALWSEMQSNPLLTNLGIEHGLNLEGKELRLGITSSVTFLNAATATATGTANASFNCLMPLTRLILIFNMSLGEIIFGGVGSGFASMIFYIILTTFLVGLMIGRSPEIYGKKLDTYEMLITVVALFLPCILQLIFTSFALIFDTHTASNLGNAAHRLYEISYTYISTINNNGSSFAGLNTDTKFYNLTTAVAMFLGFIIKNILILAVAGSLVQKGSSPRIARFPTTGFMFILVLVVLILFISITTFLPTLGVGPILEYLYLLKSC